MAATRFERLRLVHRLPGCRENSAAGPGVPLPCRPDRITARTGPAGGGAGVRRHSPSAP